MISEVSSPKCRRKISATARGLFFSLPARSMARFVEKSPWAGSRGRSRISGGGLVVFSAPLSRARCKAVRRNPRRRSFIAPSLLTIWAQPVEFDSVVLDREVVIRDDLFQEGLDMRVEEFLNLSAVDADQVIMMSLLEIVLVTGLTVTKMALLSQARITQEA